MSPARPAQRVEHVALVHERNIARVDLEVVSQDGLPFYVRLRERRPGKRDLTIDTPLGGVDALISALCTARDRVVGRRGPGSTWDARQRHGTWAPPAAEGAS